MSLTSFAQTTVAFSRATLSIALKNWLEGTTQLWVGNKIFGYAKYSTPVSFEQVKNYL